MFINLVSHDLIKKSYDPEEFMTDDSKCIFKHRSGGKWTKYPILKSGKGEDKDHKGEKALVFRYILNTEIVE